MPRRVLQGTVVSDKADKTIIVRVDRRVQDPLYKKYITRSKKYAAHDEQNRCKIGDIVRDTPGVQSTTASGSKAMTSSAVSTAAQPMRSASADAAGRRTSATATASSSSEPATMST